MGLLLFVVLSVVGAFEDWEGLPIVIAAVSGDLCGLGAAIARVAGVPGSPEIRRRDCLDHSRVCPNRPDGRSRSPASSSWFCPQRLFGSFRRSLRETRVCRRKPHTSTLSLRCLLQAVEDEVETELE